MPPDLLRRALAAAIGAAPAAADWLARCAGWTEALPDPGDPADLDLLMDAAWRTRGKAGRRALGQVFTPRAVARQVLIETPGADDGGLLDPACGGGVFLAEAAGRRGARARAAGRSGDGLAAELLADLHGVDLDSETCRLARLVLGLAVAREALSGPADPSTWLLPSVRCGDATDPAVTEPLRGRVRTVVGNPPYREAKGMPAAERNRLRARFPVDGAFDLYVCFVLLALDLAGPQGAVGLVLPNKFLVARYAADLRRRLAADDAVHAILDLSELDVFGRIGVYPVVLVLGPPKSALKAVFAVPSAAALGVAPLAGVAIAHDVVRRLADPPLGFTVPAGPLLGLIERIAGRVPPLRLQVEVRSTCSFHARGLRERFVGPGDAVPDGLPYLGGRSFTRRNEVVPFGVRWDGYRIRFAEAELKALGNPLPPLAVFARPKVVLCQHARAPIAWFDAEGRFVTKDVYPVAAAADPVRTAALAGVLNSRVFGVVYALMFRGIAIGSGYLHVLPAFLHAVPLPPLDAVADGLADAVVAVQADPTPERFEAIDAVVSALYGLTDAEVRAVRGFAGARLAFDPDPFARR